jgi:hypothetical protein
MKADVLPSTFIWTKVKDDSGQGLRAILNRKELERQAGNKFWWGIGESKGTQVGYLLARGVCPEVIFSEMPSDADVRDSNPEGVLLWEKYITSTGPERLPQHVAVISRAHKSNGRRKEDYYALVCESPLGILRSGGGSVDSWSLYNPTGKSVGASQITAVVEYIPRNGTSPATAIYPVTARAVLAPPHFVRLTGARELTHSERRLLDEVSLEGKTVDDWNAVANKLRAP